MHPFLNHRDMARRLHNVVGIFDGEPIYIKSDDGLPLNSVWAYPLYEGGEGKIIETTDKRLNVSTYNLGYLNDEAMIRAVYISRRPTRNQTQGLCTYNSDLSPRLLRSTSLYKLLTNNFPSYDKAVDMLYNDSWSSVAFSSEYAVAKVEQDLLSLKHNERVVAIRHIPSTRWTWSASKGFRKLLEKDLSSMGVEII